MNSWTPPGWRQTRSSCGCIPQHHPLVLSSLPCSGITLQKLVRRCKPFQGVHMENCTFGRKPWMCMGRAALPKHKTRQGFVIQVTADDFTRSERRMNPCIPCCRECGLQEGKKEDPLFRWQSKGAESAQQPAGIGPVLVTPPAIWGKTWPLKALCLSPAPLYSLEGEA